MFGSKRRAEKTAEELSSAWKKIEIKPELVEPKVMEAIEIGKGNEDYEALKSLSGKVFITHYFRVGDKHIVKEALFAVIEGSGAMEGGQHVVETKKVMHPIRQGDFLIRDDLGGLFVLDREEYQRKYRELTEEDLVKYSNWKFDRPIIDAMSRDLIDREKFHAELNADAK